MLKPQLLLDFFSRSFVNYRSGHPNIQLCQRFHSSVYGTLLSEDCTNSQVASPSGQCWAPKDVAGCRGRTEDGEEPAAGRRAFWPGGDVSPHFLEGGACVNTAEYCIYIYMYIHVYIYIYIHIDIIFIIQQISISLSLIYIYIYKYYRYIVWHNM